jgi:hypothetical protein
MKRRFIVLSTLALLTVSTAAFPTTVIPPTFEELVDSATTIFVGETISRRSERFDTRESAMIVTLVTFSVIEAIKGAPGTQMHLEFMGGTVGEETLVVNGVPQFNVGDRDVVFVGNAGNTVSPLIGLAHGRFRVAKDDRTGRESVRTYDGRNFASTASLRTMGRGFPLAESVSLATFKNDIVHRMGATASKGVR